MALRGRQARQSAQKMPKIVIHIIWLGWAPKNENATVSLPKYV